MQTGTWIKTDGTEQSVRPADGKKFSLPELQKFVGGYIELTKTSKPRRDMYVNEEGLIHDLPINAKASQLIDPSYWTAGGIRGDVIVIERKAKVTA